MSALIDPATLPKISLPEPTPAATRQTRAAKRDHLPSNMKQFLAAAAFFAALLGAWEYVARYGGISRVLLPPPSDVWKYLLGAAKDGTLTVLVLDKDLTLSIKAG